MKNEGPNVFGQMPAVPKFLASLLLMLALSVTAAAQNRKISIDMQNVTVKEFFAEIEKRSDYTFAYNNSEIDLAARVSVRAVDEEIVAVVDRTLAPQRLRARIEGNRVVLSPGRAAVPPPSSAKPVKAEKTISGRVTAVSGEPIVGASVIVKGTSIGNVTGISGEYTISAEPEQTLSFAFLGYDTKEVKVGSRTTIDVTLTEQNKQISEVVVVGYAPMRKSDFTGSIASVKSSELSVTGGSKAIKYMASLGYMDQDGIISPSNHNRINARLNLDAQITKRLSVSLSYSMYDAKNRVVQAEGRMINDGVIQSALMYLPNLPAYEENGDYARSAMIKMKTEWGMNFPENPLVIAHELDI